MKLLQWLLLALLPATALADASAPTSPSEVFESIRASEKRGRLITSSLRGAIGVTLFGAGVSATGVRRFMVIGGVSTMAYSMKGFFVPTLTEELAERLAREPGPFDSSALRYFRETARANRLWDGALGTGVGAFITASGAFIEQGSFLSIFAYVSGGLMLGNGLYRLLFPSTAEKEVDAFLSRTASPAVSWAPFISETPAGRPDGLGLALSLPL